MVLSPDLARRAPSQNTQAPPVQILAFFSTQAGSRLPRPRSQDAPIVRSNFEGAVEDYCTELRTKWPTVCYSIFPGWDIRWFFDEYDFYRQGGQFLHKVLMTLMEENCKRVVDFSQGYSEANMSTYPMWLAPVNSNSILRMFDSKDHATYGPIFLEKARDYMVKCYKNARGLYEQELRQYARQSDAAFESQRNTIAEAYNASARPPFSGNAINTIRYHEMSQAEPHGEVPFLSKPPPFKKKNAKGSFPGHGPPEMYNMPPHPSMHMPLSAPPFDPNMPPYPFMPMAPGLPPQFNGQSPDIGPGMHPDMVPLHGFPPVEPQSQWQAPQGYKHGPSRNRKNSGRGGRGNGKFNENNRRSSMSFHSSDEADNSQAGARRFSNQGEGSWKTNRKFSHHSSDHDPRPAFENLDNESRIEPEATKSTAYGPSSADVEDVLTQGSRATTSRPPNVVGTHERDNGAPVSRRHSVTSQSASETAEDALVVWIGDIPEGTSSTALMQALSQFALPESVDTKESPINGRPYAFARMHSIEDASKVLPPARVFLGKNPLLIQKRYRPQPKSTYTPHDAGGSSSSAKSEEQPTAKFWPASILSKDKEFVPAAESAIPANISNEQKSQSPRKRRNNDVSVRLPVSLPKTLSSIGEAEEPADLTKDERTLGKAKGVEPQNEMSKPKSETRESAPQKVAMPTEGAKEKEKMKAHAPMMGVNAKSAREQEEKEPHSAELSPSASQKPEAAQVSTSTAAEANQKSAVSEVDEKKTTVEEEPHPPPVQEAPKATTVDSTHPTSMDDHMPPEVTITESTPATVDAAGLQPPGNDHTEGVGIANMPNESVSESKSNHKPKVALVMPNKTELDTDANELPASTPVDSALGSPSPTFTVDPASTPAISKEAAAIADIAPLYKELARAQKLVPSLVEDKAIKLAIEIDTCKHKLADLAQRVNALAAVNVQGKTMKKNYNKKVKKVKDDFEEVTHEVLLLMHYAPKKEKLKPAPVKEEKSTSSYPKPHLATTLLHKPDENNDNHNTGGPRFLTAYPDSWDKTGTRYFIPQYSSLLTSDRDTLISLNDLHASRAADASTATGLGISGVSGMPGLFTTQQSSGNDTEQVKDEDSSIPRHLQPPKTFAGRINIAKANETPVTSPEPTPRIRLSSPPPGGISYARIASSSNLKSAGSETGGPGRRMSRDVVSPSPTRASSSVRNAYGDGANDEDDWKAPEPWGPEGFRGKGKAAAGSAAGAGRK